MAFLDKLILPRRLLKAAQELAGEAYVRAQRLEIENKALQERLTALEGRHEALANKVHGQLGGRPAKRQSGNGGQPVTPMPLGAQFFPPQE